MIVKILTILVFTLLISIQIGTAQPIPDGISYEYVGCWKDSGSERALPNLMDTSKQPYTQSQCKSACSDYVFYGLQYHGECWCGNDLTRATKYGKATGCPSNGGSWTFQLYYAYNLQAFHSWWNGNAAAEADGRTIHLSCGFGEYVYVLAARYGTNCGGEPQNIDDVDNLYLACIDFDGYPVNNCQYTIDKNLIGDPAPNCDKDYFYAYLCFGEGDNDYVGCWKDKQSNRALRVRQTPFSSKTYSQNECKAACDRNHYRYYALQNYGECWCDNDLSRAIQHGKAYDCPWNGGLNTFQLFYGRKFQGVGTFWHVTIPGEASGSTKLIGNCNDIGETGNVIHIEAARYGVNCAANIDDTANLYAACDMKESCLYPMDKSVIGDPDPTCDKEYFLAWYCIY